MKNVFKIIAIMSLVGTFSHVSFATDVGKQSFTSKANKHEGLTTPQTDCNVIVVVAIAPYSIPVVELKIISTVGLQTLAILENPIFDAKDTGTCLLYKEPCYRSPHVNRDCIWKYAHRQC